MVRASTHPTVGRTERERGGISLRVYLIFTPIGADIPMPNYRRPKITGATVFFTVTLADRQSDVLVRRIDTLREAVWMTRNERPFGIEAWVVLPDHLHAVWTLPPADFDFSTRWGAIKARFTHGLRKAGFGPPPELPVVRAGRYAGLKPGLRPNKRERAVWQRRFWEHHIRGPEDYAHAISYCHIDPVKHGLASCPQDWLFSSVHRDLRAGMPEPEVLRSGSRCRVVKMA